MTVPATQLADALARYAETEEAVRHATYCLQTEEAGVTLGRDAEGRARRVAVNNAMARHDAAAHAVVAVVRATTTEDR